MALWVLQKRAEMAGAVREAGYVFDAPDDWKCPPMDTIRDPKDATQFIDVPIAVRVDASAAEIASARGEAAEAERERLLTEHAQAALVPLPNDHPTTALVNHDVAAKAAEAGSPAPQQEPVAATETTPYVVDNPEQLPVKGTPVTPAPLEN